MTDLSPPSDHYTVLASLAEASNEKLLDAGQTGTNHAFNLGCYIGLLPVIATTVIVFFVTRGGWGAAGITAILLGVALVAFANLAAFQAGKNSIDRVYKQEIKPEIEQTLQTMALPRSLFDQVAGEVLPVGAPLGKFINYPNPSGSANSESF